MTDTNIKQKDKELNKIETNKEGSSFRVKDLSILGKVKTKKGMIDFVAVQWRTQI